MEDQLVSLAGLKGLRKAKKLTRPALADLCGTTATTIYRIERGMCMPRKPLLERLCLALGVHVGDLLQQPVESAAGGAP